MDQRRLATGSTRLFSRLRLRRWLIPLVILLALPLTLIDTAAQDPVNTGNRALFEDTVPHFVRTPAMRSCPITLGLGESMDISLRLVPLADRIRSYVNPADVPDVAHALVGVHATPAMYHLPLVVALSGGQSANTAESITFQVTPGATHSYTIRGNAQGSDSLLRLSRYYWDDGGGNSTPATFISARSYRVNVIAPFTYDPRPTPTVRFRRSTETITEGQTLTFRVDVHPPPTQDMQLSYYLRNDALGREELRHIDMPARCAKLHITVPTVDDDNPQHSRTYGVRLAQSTGYTVDTTADVATGTVMDNDELAAIFDDSQLKIAGTASASYGVKLNKQPQSDVTVNISPAQSANEVAFDFITGGTDEAPTLAKSHSLDFTTSNWEEPQRVTIRSAGQMPGRVCDGGKCYIPFSYRISLQHDITGTSEIVESRSLPMKLDIHGRATVSYSVLNGGATTATIYSPAASAGDASKPTSVTLSRCANRHGYDHGFSMSPRLYYAFKPALATGMILPIKSALGMEPVTFDQPTYPDRTSTGQCVTMTLTAIDLTKTQLDDIHCYSVYNKEGYAGRGHYSIDFYTGGGAAGFRLTVIYPDDHYVSPRVCLNEPPTPG